MKLTFIAPDGTETTVEVTEGTSVMRAALLNDVDGIIGECGGSMMCATCHCYVDEAWAGAVGAQSDGEADLLDCAVSEIRATSRLSCQITMRPALDGLIVHLPEAQI